MDSYVAIVGAGSWGTTVASIIAHNHQTKLWARRDELARQIMSQHQNPDYLPGRQLAQELICSADLEQVVTGASVVMMAVPSSGFRTIAVEVAKYVEAGVPIVSLTKGLEPQSLKRMSEVLADEFQGHPIGVLTGPNLAHEILSGQPAATVAASVDSQLAVLVQKLVSRPTLRVYTNPDIVGCEIGGAVKNVIAIAAGIVEGMQFGDNSKATLITRGVAEMSRLGVALGANPITFTGLAGLGDVVATCASPLSRNMAVGVRLGQGESIDAITSSMTMVAEGVSTSLSVWQLAQQMHVDMPITEQVAAVCESKISAKQALLALMARASKSEFD